MKNTDRKATDSTLPVIMAQLVFWLQTVCMFGQRETSLKSNLSPHSLGARETRMTETD